MRKVFGKKKTTLSQSRVVGDIRQSQLITSFGCGSIVDFVNDTVIIAGTDSWDWSTKTPDNKFIIYNENLQNVLGKEYFVKPKTDARRRAVFTEKSKDIPAFRFPEILYCVKCHRLYHHGAFDYQTGKQIKCVCGNKSIVPSRFVVVCENGHIEDFPYSEWVHMGEKCSANDNPRLLLYNIGGKSGIGNLFVKCISCGAIRRMQGAFAENALTNIKKCTSNSPWLMKKHNSECGQKLKARLRTATNVYFPVTMSALSIPPWSRRIFKKLESYYDVISINPGVAEQVIRKVIQPEFPDMSFEDIMFAFKKLEKVKNGESRRSQIELQCDEYLVLTKNESNDEEYSSQFVEAPSSYKHAISKVVAVDKLTEVVAMLGFTRINPWSGKIDDERIAPLSSVPQNWLPAVQMNGEGIFIEFVVERLNAWADSVGSYYMSMKENMEKSFFENERFSPQYVFLHTFAHLLIRQLALECGYSAASLKEKIYSNQAGDDTDLMMAGVLIYTASPDSDGSLGGLVEQSTPEKLGIIIDNMLDSAQWCSSDPLCVMSYGKNGQGFDSLNYAACHACTLLPETSCEFRNLLLDRGALIGRPDRPELGFFNMRFSL